MDNASGGDGAGVGGDKALWYLMWPAILGIAYKGPTEEVIRLSAWVDADHAK